MVNTQIQHDAIIASMIDINSLYKDGFLNSRIIRYPYTGEGIQYISREIDPSSYRMWDIIVKSTEESPNIPSNFEVVLETLEDQTNLPLQRIYEELRFMSENEYNWEMDGSENPSKLSFDNMQKILEHIFKEANHRQYLWIHPFLHDDCDGTLCAEWHYGDRSLHFDFKDDSIEYTKIGSSINSNSESGYTNIQNSFSLWKWLIDG